MSNTRKPEVDGLRAVAIIPVVLYHAGWTVLPGGFAGVDVFFVISGYLITRILDDEIGGGRFSLSGFYERRVRRILPALLVVLFATTAIASAIMPPHDLLAYTRSQFSTVVFLANEYFTYHAGYFDPKATTAPLLHTWSLSVEEQFYLVFPLVMLASHRWLGDRKRWIVVLIAIASLALSIYGTRMDATAAFYSPLTRAWELMAGALAALGVFARIARPLVRQVLAAVGLLAIVTTVLIFRGGGDYPGLAALLPVAGSVLLILYSRGTAVGRVLCLPPVVGIGLVSYSLYLWHWPLLVLASYWLIRPLTLLEGTLIVAVSLVLAVASSKFVEQPFRGRTRITRANVFVAATAAVAILLTFSTLAEINPGLPQRLPPEVARLAAFADDVSPRREECHLRKDIPPDMACAYGAPVSPTIAVWSDSHGVELADALGEQAARKGRALVLLSGSSCPPGSENAHCMKRNRQVLDFLLRTPRIGTVILNAFWVSDMKGSRFSQIAGGLQKAVASLRSAGRTVVLTYPTGVSESPVPGLLALEAWTGHFETGLVPLAQFRNTWAEVYQSFDRLVSQYGLVPIDPAIIYCPNGECVMYRDGVALYFDMHHPSLSGARLLAPLYADVIAKSDPPPTNP